MGVIPELSMGNRKLLESLSLFPQRRMIAAKSSEINTEIGRGSLRVDFSVWLFQKPNTHLGCFDTLKAQYPLC